ENAESGDVIAPTSGTSSLVYIHPRHAGKSEAIGAFLTSRDWVDRVIPAAELATVGLTSQHGLAFAVSFKSDDQPNEFVIRRRSIEAQPAAGKLPHLGCGQHGGLARYEQSPFLLIEGDGFTAGGRYDEPTAPVDLAPTILTHLGLAAGGMDGRPLQSRAQE